ncbi:MAG: hypothetical protein H7X94_03525 [Vallitaleaceae bacterium]|nr:hypothetical protein [Vallitaleaceae bacterium]
MKKVDVYQSLWGMRDLPNQELPWSIEEQVCKIKEAGFDGILQFVDDFSDETQNLTELIKNAGLKLGLSCVGYHMEDIEGKIKYAKNCNAEFLNIMVKDYFIVGKEATLLLENILRFGKAMMVPTFIETHRGTITQDLIRTTEYLKSIPELQLTIDFSHYVVSGEISIPEEKVEECFDALLKRAAAIHIRISNGEQVQVPIHGLDDGLYANFIRWWQKGIDYAMSHGEVKKPFPIVVELGPHPYQQKFSSPEGEWLYDYNRWEEALRWKNIIEKF